jgi:hypothetical protein
MKFKYLLLLLATLVFLFGSATKIIAQDEMIVEWDDGSGNIVQDALYNAVMGDTIAGGVRANLNRVYVLKTGGYYWNYQTISNNFPLRIVGQTPGSTFETHPAVVQMVTDIVGGGAPGKMITCSSDLTLKNLYLIGQDELGTGGYYQPIEINAANKRFVFDNCVFERSDFSMIAWAGGHDNDITITNCTFRNLIERHPTQQWTGRGLSVWTDADSIIIENNTFFNVNMCAIQIENGAANYVRFNHNTLVDIGRAMSSTSNVWWREAYFANCLYVNVYWHGDGACDYRADYQPGRDPRAYYTGIFPVNPMPSRYGTDIGRRILFTNSAAYLDNFFTSRYADTVRVQPFTNTVTDSFFTTYSPTNGGQMLIQDTTWLSANPNFTANPNTPAQLQAMYDHITASRGYQYYQSGVQALPYYYALPVVSGDTLWAEPSWPLPENFTYSDANMLTAGTDGLPLGDLNWFQTQKADFELNKDAYIAAIENMPGGRIVEDVVFEDQAENGTLGGTAAVVPFTGESWYTLTGGSNIEWTFNSSYNGPVDLKLRARPDGSNIGFDFILNGGNFVDAARGWGQFVFWTGPEDPQTFWTGKSTSEFYETTYLNSEIIPMGHTNPFVVSSGTNTLKLQYSWNPVSFSWIEFYEAGTTNLVASLIPANAVNSGATPGGQGVWVPLGFNSVALGNDGSTAFNVDLSTGGTYKVRVFFQNPNTSQTGRVLLDGTEAITYPFDSNPDSLGLNVISGLFNASSGAHTLTISGSGVNVDWLQLIRQYITDVDDRGEIPNGFALSQNYPNPFNPTTKINFDLGKASDVKLIVYDILGRKVATLVNQFMNTGAYTVNFDASHFASGVYFYSIEAGDFKLNKKMILLK